MILRPSLVARQEPQDSVRQLALLNRVQAFIEGACGIFRPDIDLFLIKEIPAV
jgi:hypothetical protein